ncbi:helix-turn-helix transcriptional regulator [Kamptonema sp. UHCC 0994]|uniref:helix-turn-helix domain-containing protein n=1 Tax=Kamptonema sp. UHCC 0994 TaxID=3031329 RepID=UPI0023B94D36|nr:helix-turn-helix transcriptional regulator [Kamptonema sp. UHCC 0994]MDF0553120.1 helix-turn-helix transcriptional regulator [Kamptonema sp. UHCC 0994]
MPVIISIRKLREKKGLSQNDLARLTGYSPQFIQKIEQRKAKSLTLDAAERFVTALDCEPGELLQWEPPEDKLKTALSGSNQAITEAKAPTQFKPIEMGVQQEEGDIQREHDSA